jgi:hypothetical protein
MLTQHLKILTRALLGPVGTWNLKSRSRLASADVAARLQDTLARTAPENHECDDQPIFLLSAGWRSGSTLLQRMVMESNRDVIIWGEPFSHCNIPECMASQFRAFTSQWPTERFFLSKRSLNDLSDEWVANLYPDVDCLLKAHRLYFDAVFGEPARAIGRSHWGVKETKLTIDHAMYFRALYPKCKIVLLYRDPYDAFLSYRRVDAAWFRRWPEDPVKTPYAYGRLWAGATRGFLEGHQKVDGVLIRYEDLDNSSDLERLSKYLGWTVSRSSSLKRRDFAPPREGRVKLPRLDRLILDFATGDTRKVAGYGGASHSRINDAVVGAGARRHFDSSDARMSVRSDIWPGQIHLG